MAEKPTTTLPGTVQKIIKSPDPSVPEKAEIAVEGADELYKEIRVENTLTDEKGQEVKLKPGAEVRSHHRSGSQRHRPEKREGKCAISRRQKTGKSQGQEAPAKAETLR